MATYTDMIKVVNLPKMVKIRQSFSRPRVENVAEAVLGELSRPEISQRIKPGATVAITAGSRGIGDIVTILKTVVDFCRAKGAEPFIFPAMGSHGGGTAEGQLGILHSYGITEESCGCPIIASMEVKEIGRTEEGHPVRIDKQAAEADAVIVVNRIKAHTAFRGPYESGLMKMMTIGMGKHEGAKVCHEAGFGVMHHLVPLFGKVIMQNANIAFGLALIENAYDELCLAKALLPEEIITEEPGLLEYSKSLMGSILFKNADVLIVDNIGKNFSGEGADPNISGRFPTPYATGGLNAERRVCLGLSEESHGCGYGVGLFDTISRRMFEQLDLDATYTNAITNTVLGAVAIPVIMPSDREAIMTALYSCNNADRSNPRIVRIANTAQIEEIYISEAMVEEAKANPNIELISEPAPFDFDKDGNFTGF